MTGKKGVTLIEAVIAIAVIAIAVVALLQGLSVATFGAMDASLKTSALNLAKTQLEYVKSQSYNTSFKGNLSQDYGLIDARNMSSKGNFTISGNVSYVNANNTRLQKITVNVSYTNGKRVQVIGYKNADLNTLTYNYSPTGWWAWERAWTYTEHQTNGRPNSPNDFFGSYTYPWAAATTTEYGQVATINNDPWHTDRCSWMSELNTQLYTITILQSSTSKTSTPLPSRPAPSS